MTGLKDTIDRSCGDSFCKDKGTYRTIANCTNCGWGGYMVVTKGHEAYRAAMQARCPRCDCRSVQTGAYVEDAA